MVEIQKDKVLRDGQTVGYVEGDYIYDHNYTKVGYVDGDYVKDMTGAKLAEISGEYLESYSDNAKTELDQINESVKGDAVPEIVRCAVYQLIGA